MVAYNIPQEQKKRRFNPFLEREDDDEQGDQKQTRGIELLSYLNSLGQRPTTREVNPAAAPALSAPSSTNAGASFSNQLNQIAKWGQYSMKPPPPKVSKEALGRRMMGGGNSAFDKFLRAIAGQESGGRYGAVNRSSGAMGKYQIMPFNIKGKHRGWDWEVLGRDISTSQFMRSPKLQEQIAQAKLRGYFKKYGARGAAEAWYGGPGSIGRGYVRGYSNSILRRMGLR